MRLVHSFSVTLLVSALACAASLSGCSSDEGDAGDSKGGTSTGGAATGGSSTGGTATGGSGVTGGTGTTGGSGGSGVTGGSSGASATGGSGGSGGGGANDHPTDSTQAGIEAFLAAGSWKTTGMGWKEETAASTGMSVHGTVKRYFNQTLSVSYAAGDRTNMQDPGSMVVKDLLTNGASIGQAAMLKTDTGWVFYCKASEDSRCITGSTANTAIYGATGAATGCSCHTTGIIISGDVIPAP